MSIDCNFEDVLHVLAIAVIIDEKIREREVEEFIRQAEGLYSLFAQDQDRSGARDWFIANKPKILEQMASRGRNTVILKALTRVKDPMVRENLYDAMIAVSMSDEEYHKEESDFIRSAASIWGYARPPFKVSRS